MTYRELASILNSMDEDTLDDDISICINEEYLTVKGFDICEEDDVLHVGHLILLV